MTQVRSLFAPCCLAFFLLVMQLLAADSAIESASIDSEELEWSTKSSDGAIERTIFDSETLDRRTKSSFYLLGFCSAPFSPECFSLSSLHESSQSKITRYSLIKSALLLYNSEYWTKQLNVTQQTQIWFACHDGQRLRLMDLRANATATAAAVDAAASDVACTAQRTNHSANSSSSSAFNPHLSHQHQHKQHGGLHSKCKTQHGAIESNQASYVCDSQSDCYALALMVAAAATARCSPETPWYDCRHLTNDMKLDLLMYYLATAAQQQGAECIAGQLQTMHPEAAAAATAAMPTTTLLSPEAVAAAVAADPEGILAAVNERLTMIREYVADLPQWHQYKEYQELGFFYLPWIVLKFVGTVIYYFIYAICWIMYYEIIVSFVIVILVILFYVVLAFLWAIDMLLQLIFNVKWFEPLWDVLPKFDSPGCNDAAATKSSSTVGDEKNSPGLV